MYIDIHTHKLPVADCNVLQVNNLYSDFYRVKEGMRCSIGLHPWHMQNSSLHLAELKEFAAYDNVLAIGECGLDKVCDTNWDLQQRIFREQVLLAKSLQKPIVVHCVRAFAEVMGILEEIKPAVPVVFHGYNRGRNIAEELLVKGFFLSFGAAILKDGAVADVLGDIPAEKFFCETDDSDVTIDTVYNRAADIRKVSAYDIILQVEENFKRVFKRN